MDQPTVFSLFLHQQNPLRRQQRDQHILCPLDPLRFQLLAQPGFILCAHGQHSALHMPIHTNAFNGDVAGLRIFVYKLGGEAEKIAKAIMAELAPITPGKSDGISAVPGLYEIRNTNATCVYLEVGFHDNPEEAQWIIDHTEEIAEAICKGLCKHYGVKYVAPEAENSGALYRVQIGSFRIRDNAKNMLSKAKAAGFQDAFIVEVKQ